MARPFAVAPSGAFSTMGASKRRSVLGRLFRLFELPDQLVHLVDLGRPAQNPKSLPRGAEDFQGAGGIGLGEELAVELANDGDAVGAADPADEVPGFGEPFQGPHSISLLKLKLSEVILSARDRFNVAELAADL